MRISQSRAASGAGGRMGARRSARAFLLTCPRSGPPAVTSTQVARPQGSPDTRGCLPPCGDRCFLKGRVGVGNEMGVSTSEKDSSEISIALGSQRLGFFFFSPRGEVLDSRSSSDRRDCGSSRSPAFLLCDPHTSIKFINWLVFIEI